MTWLELEMAILDAARTAAGLCVNWFIQSALLVLGGLLVGHALRRHGSAVQSAVYRTTLVAVLASPLATWGLTNLGMTGWSLEMPLAYVLEAIPAAETPIEPAPPLVDESAPVIFSTQASVNSLPEATAPPKRRTPRSNSVSGALSFNRCEILPNSVIATPHFSDSCRCDVLSPIARRFLA